jgi:hypothetical protein
VPFRKALNKPCWQSCRAGGARRRRRAQVHRDRGRGRGVKARRAAIALSIANSPLVKTAIAGEDANWGRVVMAVGKAGEPADRDRLSIWFGGIRVAHKGARDPGYDEAAVSAAMKKPRSCSRSRSASASGRDRVLTCDLTKEYVAINGDYIAYAKANPGKINVGSTGNGTLTHMAAELFKMMAGVDMLHVPYRGETAAQADLLSDRVQVMFDPIPSSLGYIRSGQLRALAVTATAPMDLLPDVPTMAQFLPAYEVFGTTGISAPRGISDAIITVLNKAIDEGLTDPKLKARFADLATEVVIGSPADFGKIVADETEKWAKVIKFANIKAE